MYYWIQPTQRNITVMLFCNAQLADSPLPPVVSGLSNILSDPCLNRALAKETWGRLPASEIVLFAWMRLWCGVNKKRDKVNRHTLAYWPSALCCTTLKQQRRSQEPESLFQCDLVTTAAGKATDSDAKPGGKAMWKCANSKQRNVATNKSGLFEQ